MKIIPKLKIIKGLLGLKSRFEPGGLRLNYSSFADLAEDMPNEYINPLSLMDYYAWWLDHRRSQLELNMKDTHTYPLLGWIDSFRNIYNGYEPGRIALNLEIYKQLENIKSSIYRYDSDFAPKLGSNSDGQYFGLDDPDGDGVVIRKGLDKNSEYSTILHELTHNANDPRLLLSGQYSENSARSPQEKKILQIGVNSDAYYDLARKDYPDILNLLNYENTYLNIPSEVYARMMLFRHENKLDPNKKYTVEEIKKLIKNSKVRGIETYDVEKLTKALNEVALNNSKTATETLYTKHGGLIPKKRVLINNN